MKKVLTKFLAFSSLALLMLSSCKKNDTLVVAKAGAAGTLTASTETLVLDKSQANSTDSVITFTFTKANYGFNAAVTTTLQIDSMGDDWTPAKMKSVTLTGTVAKLSYTTDDFNNILLKLHLPTGVESQVQIRLMQSISTSITPVYSNIVTLKVTPYSNASYVYVPGAYQGWSPGSAPTLVSPKSDGIYTGIINFTSSASGQLDFKITPAPVWDNSYGSTDNKALIYDGGNNITAPAAGGLLLTVNLNNNTISFAPQWSVIGDASPGGWGADTNMEFDAVTNTWFLTVHLVSDGGQAIKFRFANDWTVNLGGSGGTLSQNGANITIPNTGTGGADYKVVLDPVANTYTLTKL